MRVLVTGANGFVGCNIVASLRGAGHEAVAYNRPEAPIDLLEPFGPAIRRGTLDDPRALQSAFDEVDAVIHTAGNSSTRRADHAALDAANARGPRGPRARRS